MYEPLLTNLERQERLVAISESRMQYHAKNKMEEHAYGYRELSKKTSIGVHDGCYYVELGLGEFDDKPYQPIYLVLDTGSDITWTQCQDCSPGFYQTEPPFQHGHSRSFEPCRANECPNGRTSIRISYYDGATVVGVWATDTLTFPSLQNDDETKEKYTFLCANEVQNFVQANNGGFNNKITGILGMGRGPLSLMSQIQDEGLHAFSYCLPRHYATGYSPSFLNFGDSELRVPGMSSTPLFGSPNNCFYYVRLMGISIDETPVNIPHYMLAIREDGSGGTTIDSGSECTYLIPSAYNILLAEFTAFMSRSNPTWRRCPGHAYDACWAPGSRSPTIDKPQFTLHFENGAELYVEGPEVMIESGTAQIPYMECLSVKPRVDNSYTNVIGARHQIEQLMVFDLRESTLFFLGVDCNY